MYRKSIRVVYDNENMGFKWKKTNTKKFTSRFDVRTRWLWNKVTPCTCLQILLHNVQVNMNKNICGNMFLHFTTLCFTWSMPFLLINKIIVIYLVVLPRTERVFILKKKKQSRPSVFDITIGWYMDYDFTIRPNQRAPTKKAEANIVPWMRSNQKRRRSEATEPELLPDLTIRRSKFESTFVYDDGGYPKVIIRRSQRKTLPLGSTIQVT